MKITPTEMYINTIVFPLLLLLWIPHWKMNYLKEFL